MYLNNHTCKQIILIRRNSCLLQIMMYCNYYSISQLHPNLPQLFLIDIIEKTGFVFYKIETSSPPHGGMCDFSPKNGTAMLTNFTFNCYNWKDDGDDSDAVLLYKVLYSFGTGSTKETFLLYHGPKNTVSDLKLPGAPDKYNNTFNLTVRVEDAFKSFNEKRFTIKVCFY